MNINLSIMGGQNNNSPTAPSSSSSVLSKLSIPRHLIARAASLDVPLTSDSSVGDENRAVHQLKHIMDVVRRENPHLSIGAVQKMALQRCAKLNGEREEEEAREQSVVATRRFSVPDDLLRVMSKFHVSKQLSSHLTAETESSVEVTPSTTQESTSTSKAAAGGVSGSSNRRRSIAIMQSVRLTPEEQRALECCGESESDSDDDSLQDDLDNIEKSIREKNNSSDSENIEKSLDRNSRRSLHGSSGSFSFRHTRRLSDLSGCLSDVEEDAKSKEEGDGVPAKGEERTKIPLNDEIQNQGEMNPTALDDILPDEIRVLLGKTTQESPTTCNDNQEEELSPASAAEERRRNRRVNTRQGQQQQQHRSSLQSSLRSEHSSCNSSFHSMDSANFHGDFWAWRSDGS